jgi:hypothetical protein
MLAPLVVTATAIDHGTGGWVVLGSLFAVTGILTAVLARHAAAARAEGRAQPQRSEYVASETPV